MSQNSSWLKGLRGKLLVSAFLPLIAFAVLTWLAISTMDHLGTYLKSAYLEVIPNTDSLGQITTERASIGYFMWAAYGVKNSEENKAFTAKAGEAFERFKIAQDKYEKASFTPEEERNYASVAKDKARFYQLTTEMIQNLELNTAEGDAAALAYLNGGEWHKMSINIRKASQANTKIYQDLAIQQNEIQTAERQYKSQLILMTALAAGFAMFAILMWIAYKVSHSISFISKQLTEAGTQVSGAIGQLTGAGQVLSQSSTESAASLEETVASLEEMTSMVSMNSDNAKQAASLSQSSKDAAELGHTEIKLLIESMQAISSSSRKIEEIISVIDDIAFQTNLLALNASVEAARAGEQGKGFAVVAEAVRALAQRSASAAKDINALIKDSADKVEHGAKTADKSGEVLNTILTSVKKVADLNNEIAAASSEQTTGIQQISKAMNQLDQGSQANAASSEEIAASAEEISAQASQMEKLVQSLDALIQGSTSKPQPPKPKLESSLKKAPKKAATVHNLRPRPAAKKAAKSSSAQAIPFDDDGDSFGKIGTTDGF